MTAIPETVAAYKDECEAILSWIKPDTWLDQDEFDRLSFEWRHSDRMASGHHFTPGTIVLPFNGDPNLAILQELQRNGIIEARERGNKIEYRLVR